MVFLLEILDDAHHSAHDCGDGVGAAETVLPCCVAARCFGELNARHLVVEECYRVGVQFVRWHTLRPLSHHLLGEGGSNYKWANHHTKKHTKLYLGKLTSKN